MLSLQSASWGASRSCNRCGMTSCSGCNKAIPHCLLRAPLPPPIRGTMQRALRADSLDDAERALSWSNSRHPKTGAAEKIFEFFGGPLYTAGQQKHFDIDQLGKMWLIA